jgi:hypothetical protein
MHCMGKKLTPHGGIWLNASVAASGAACTLKLKALANSAIETARCQNITKFKKMAEEPERGSEGRLLNLYKMAQ